MLSDAPPPPRIEICGGIGAGKSTCAALLATHWSLPLVLERFEDVPHWRAFYDDPARFALEKDLGFLLSHADSLRAAGDTPTVCDFAMVQTVAYSAIAGDAADTAAVAAVHDRMTARLGRPALIVRLRCDTGVQLARIAARGRAPEAGITRDYLDRLDAAIDAQLARLPATVAQVTFDTTAQAPAALLAVPALQAAMAAVAGGANRPRV